MEGSELPRHSTGKAPPARRPAHDPYGGLKVQEGVVDVCLSRLLTEWGVGSAALVQFNGIPDVYLINRGMRVVLEAKEEGNEKALEEQLKDRIKRNLCELAIGIIFPRAVTTGIVPPPPQEVEKRLGKAALSLLAVAQGTDGPTVIAPWRDCRLGDLPELIASLAGQAVPEGELDENVAKIKEAVSRFTQNMLGSENPEGIAKAIKEVLEGAG